MSYFLFTFITYGGLYDNRYLMKTILYVTDFYYEAKGRKYYEEDLYITSKLKAHFNILIGHPHQAISFIDSADLIVFRNTGAIMEYQDYFNQFLVVVNKKNSLNFNSFDGKADIKGKQYLLDLMKENYPVIPTVGTIEELQKLGNSEKYIVKIKNGADSIGMKILNKKELLKFNPSDQLIQPLLDFEYEVSFYYLNDEYQYALYAQTNKEGGRCRNTSLLKTTWYLQKSLYNGIILPAELPAWMLVDLREALSYW
jgi:hypothetical protein